MILQKLNSEHSYPTIQIIYPENNSEVEIDVSNNYGFTVEFRCIHLNQDLNDVLHICTAFDTFEENVFENCFPLNDFWPPHTAKKNIKLKNVLKGRRNFRMSLSEKSANYYKIVSQIR